ncbi:c-type cytochrome [Pseudoduganella namucuonensis]|uniref:Cytochrome c556 n=1 Tax=Pseudoduganella namucuonensis TaxID=1035707 RepID=A0A1I7M656_9BURK|nr:cytochrome c [Pseudoduganella namucuonensis]SFV17425.1 Cytochrome c556 [Pseudoduganella namucuonensis]
MKHIKKIAATAVALAILAGSGAAIAQQAPKPEQLIKWRQSAFQVVAWNTGRIKASLDGTYNKDEVQRAANSIAAIANGGLGALFAAGTEQGKGWHDTTAKPELFKDGKKFGELGASFGKEANDLAAIAGNGDVAAIKAQFAKLQRTCKGCHDDFKNKD